MRIRFDDQVAIVTGAGTGLGRSHALGLAARGARVVVNDFSPAGQRPGGPSPAEQVSTEIRMAGGEAIANHANVADQNQVGAMVEEAKRKWGRIDMLVNNAGILREGYFEELPMQAFRDVMEINYFGILHATRAALPHLRKARGRLVNIASMAGLTGAFGYTPYCSAKHALMGLTDCLYYELEPQGIKVQLVCPGEFDSPLVDELETYRTPENRVHTLSIPKSSLDTIVEGTIAGIRADKHCIIPSAGARVMAFVLRHLPGLARVIARQKIRKVYRGPVVARPVPD